jgi:hypothetical protein
MVLALTEQASDVFWFLTEWEFGFGLIGWSEVNERLEMLQWLQLLEDGCVRDPRGDDDHSYTELTGAEGVPEPNPEAGEPSAPSAENLPIEFLPLGLRHRWCFTKGDRDFYPSVPHGHLTDKNVTWPKLNPYNGKAFSSKDSEDRRFRLSRQELITLWSNDRFRQHCLDMVIWYQNEYPRFRFAVLNPLRFPRPWRK